MRFAELETVIAEARIAAEAEFVDRHPTIAFVVETPDEEAEASPDAETVGPEYTKALTIRLPRSAFAKALELPPNTHTKIHWPSAPDERLFRFGRDVASEILLVHPRISKRHVTI